MRYVFLEDAVMFDRPVVKQCELRGRARTHAASQQPVTTAARMKETHLLIDEIVYAVLVERVIELRVPDCVGVDGPWTAAGAGRPPWPTSSLTDWSIRRAPTPWQGTGCGSHDPLASSGQMEDAAAVEQKG